MVRAVVAAEADRAAFDKWYADEHLPGCSARARPAAAGA